MDTVSDILAKKGKTVVSIEATESVLSAARVMNERGIGGVVVTDNGKMVGVFTERDILRRVVADERDPATTSVSQVMTSPVVQCSPDTALERCSGIMTEKRIRHLPVGDESGPCGMITSGDILAFQVREQEFTIQQLNSYVHNLR